MSFMRMAEITSNHFEENDYMFEHFLPRYDEVWLFGTGLYATAFNKYLNLFNVVPKGFVVSDLSKNPSNKNGKPVIDVNELKVRYKKTPKKPGLLLTVTERYYNELLHTLDFMNNYDLYMIPEETKQFAKNRFSEINNIIITVSIIFNCNLNCYGCNAASPCVNSPDLYEVEQFERDLFRISNLISSSSILEICITGGEPLLHPHLIDILVKINSILPNVNISLITNGVALSKQTDEFWEALGRYKVCIQWTQYPIKYELPVSELHKKSQLYGFSFRCYGGDEDVESIVSWRIPFDVKANQKPYDFIFCEFHRCNGSLSIRNNKLYLCPQARSVEHLSAFFGEIITLQKGVDYLEIDKIKDKQQIKSFLNNRIHLCNFCNIRKRENLGKWLPSKRYKSEWFIIDDENLN